MGFSLHFSINKLKSRNIVFKSSFELKNYLNASKTIRQQKIDSYSALIFAKYFKTKEDFVNLICVNSKFKETTEKFRYNPISIKSLKLFPKIQTQHLYMRDDKLIKTKQIVKYEIWHGMDYKEYTQYGKINNVKCHNVEYTKKNSKKYGEKFFDGVTLLGYDCFSGYSTLSSINLPSTLTSLGDYCFYECRTLSIINLLSSLQSIGDWCFSGCSTLSTIILPPALTSLGDGCFSGCSTLSSIILPTSLSSLSRECFLGCSTLSSIILPSPLSSIGDYCFSKCSTLSSINLPSSLSSFGKSCFYKCPQLKGVINVPSYCFDKPF